MSDRDDGISIGCGTLVVVVVFGLMAGHALDRLADIASSLDRIAESLANPEEPRP